MQFTIKIFNNRSMVQRVRTHKKRRFLKIIRSINWQNSMIKVYVKVRSEEYYVYRGRRIRAYNDGTCINREDFLFVLNAFLAE